MSAINAVVNWPTSGTTRSAFHVYDINTSWRDVPGIYIFAYEQSPGRWTALYVGQAMSLNQRLSSHERIAEAIRLGATHIHVKVIQNSALRDAEERLLIGQLQPRLNTYLR